MLLENIFILLDLAFMIQYGEGNGNPLQCSCLENPRDGGAWWPAVYGVAQSWTRLKLTQQQQQHELISLFPKTPCFETNNSEGWFTSLSIVTDHLSDTIAGSLLYKYQAQTERKQRHL